MQLIILILSFFNLRKAVSAACLSGSGNTALHWRHLKKGNILVKSDVIRTEIRIFAKRGMHPLLLSVLAGRVGGNRRLYIILRWHGRVFKDTRLRRAVAVGLPHGALRHQRALAILRLRPPGRSLSTVGSCRAPHLRAVPAHGQPFAASARGGLRR